ncbi:hypothetical protein PENTCL1PPCAC_9510, partial [Pristionchus entomophagus]
GELLLKVGLGFGGEGIVLLYSEDDLLVIMLASYLSYSLETTLRSRARRSYLLGESLGFVSEGVDLLLEQVVELLGLGGEFRRLLLEGGQDLILGLVVGVI